MKRLLIPFAATAVRLPGCGSSAESTPTRTIAQGEAAASDDPIKTNTSLQELAGVAGLA